MTQVFLDTNIILDVIEQRPSFVLASSNVIDLGIRGKIRLHASPLTFANCVYIARKNVGYQQAIKGLRFLKQHIRITSMDDQQTNIALNSDMPDFEDMLQYESALSAGCEVIITRDRNRHFPMEGIPIQTPEEFLNSIYE